LEKKKGEWCGRGDLTGLEDTIRSGPKRVTTSINVNNGVSSGDDGVGDDAGESIQREMRNQKKQTKTKETMETMENGLPYIFNQYAKRIKKGDRLKCEQKRER